jgi:hypothetical protein
MKIPVPFFALCVLLTSAPVLADVSPVSLDVVATVPADVVAPVVADDVVPPIEDALGVPADVQVIVTDVTITPVETPAEPPVVPPVKAPETDAEAGEALGQMVSLAQEGAWTAAIGMGLMIIVWLLRKVNILAAVPKSMVPWVAFGLGLLVTVGMVLAGGQSWETALVNGVGGALFAPALWELVFKHVDAKLTASPAA